MLQNGHNIGYIIHLSLNLGNKKLCICPPQRTTHSLKALLIFSNYYPSAHALGRAINKLLELLKDCVLLLEVL